MKTLAPSADSLLFKMAVKWNQGVVMDATLEMFDRLIMAALEHLDNVRGTSYEPYAEEILEALVCRREQYTHYLSLLN